VGNIQVYLATVSGTVIQRISPYKTVDDRIYDWKVKIGYSASVARLDDTHAILHYGNRNRMRIITLTPDGSGVTFGREITSMMPNNAKATELLALNETSGVVAVVGGATNIKGCLLPVQFGESGIIVPPAPPNGASWARMGIGGADNFQHTFQYNDDVNSDFRLAKLTDTRFATFYNHTGSGHSLWIMENRPSGIFIVNSGQLTPLRGTTGPRIGPPTSPSSHWIRAVCSWPGNAPATTMAPVSCPGFLTPPAPGVVWMLAPSPPSAPSKPSSSVRPSTGLRDWSWGGRSH